MTAAAVVDLPTAEELAELVGGQAGDAELIAACRQALLTVTSLARSYTRGEGFGPGAGKCAEDIAACILVAAARFLNNPENLKREEFDGYAVTPSPFIGWSLLEQMVLNRYRARAR